MKFSTALFSSLTAFALMLSIQSCTKDEEVLILGNTPKKDYTRDTMVVQNYINKTYISLLGREPIPAEVIQAKAILKAHDFSREDRLQYIDQLIAQPMFYRNLYDKARADLLQSTDSATMATFIYVLDSYLNSPTLDPISKESYQNEKTRLQTILKTGVELPNKTISVKEMYRRCIDNFYYDQYNMGSENYVVSTFQHFFLRYPSDGELESGKRMVDGFNAVVLLKIGKTKRDYQDILFASNDYYEGTVRSLFKRFLYREANSNEILYFSTIYKQNDLYEAMLREILVLDEYALY